MNTPHTRLDASEIERLRAAAYRQVPALRQQALEDAAAAIGRLWQRAWQYVRQRGQHGLGRLAGPMPGCTPGCTPGYAPGR